MRLLHTSDWHLGRTLHGESLLVAQREFLDWLVATAVQHSVDAVLVAGDVYDRAIPTTDAVSLLDRVLTGLSHAGIPTVLTSGNHDSAIRLGFGSGLQQSAGVHIRTQLADLDNPVVLTDDSGAMAVYGVPYLLPDAVMGELSAQRSHESVLRAAVRRVRADAESRGIARVVVVAHAFVTGGTASESERDIRVGGIGDAPASVFDGLTYVALGHLHGAQVIVDQVAYSGSPVAFSFSERHHTKSVTIVEVDADGGLMRHLVPTPIFRPLRQLKGRLDDLIARADTDLNDVRDAWVKVILTDPGARPAAPMERLRQKWPHTIALDFEPEGAAPNAVGDLIRVHESTEPVEICTAFVEWVDTTRPTSAQRDTLQAAIDAVVRMELSA